MNMNFLLLLVTFLYAFTSRLAYGNWFTRSGCSSLLPVDGRVGPREDEPPYVVNAYRTVGNKVRVSISSPTDWEIRGFILQARSASDRKKFIAGEFKSDEVSTTIDCFNRKKNTLTNRNNNNKSEIITEWIATIPLNEDIIFRATVEKSYAVYWKDIDSEPLRMRTVGQMSTPPSYFKRYTDIPETIYDYCFHSKGCFGMPYRCADMGDCEVLFTYERSPDLWRIRFALHGSLEPDEYMAIGLSDDNIMGDDFVTECLRGNSSYGRLRNSWNDGKSNLRTTETNDNFDFTVNDGLTTCVWTRPYTITFNGRTYNLANKMYHVLLAKGSVYNSGIGYHFSRLASDYSVNFRNAGAVSSTEVSDSVKIHDDVTKPEESFLAPDATLSIGEATNDATKPEKSFSAPDATLSSGGTTIFNLCIWQSIFIVSLKLLHFVLT